MEGLEIPVSARRFCPSAVKAVASLDPTLKVLAPMSVAEVNPSAELRSNATASALPIRSYVMRNPPRRVVLFSPKTALRKPLRKFGDQATATAGAKLFQSCG